MLSTNFRTLKTFLNQDHPMIKINTTRTLKNWSSQLLGIKMGHTLSIKYANKISYVSPCWFELQVRKNEIIFQNEGLYDPELIKKLKHQNPNIKIMPRIYVSGNQIAFFQAIGTQKQSFVNAGIKILQLLQRKQIDGIVWDTPYNYFQIERKTINIIISEFVSKIKEGAGPHKLVFFNMANPMKNMNSLEVQYYQTLKVDAILIQNYDAGQKYITLIEKSIEWAQKLGRSDLDFIMLLPFFSVKVGVGSVNTEDAIKSIQRYGLSHAEIKNNFCQFTENKTRKVFRIPCFAYFKKAFEIISDAGFSVGFWEGGNGHENYYQFF